MSEWISVMKELPTQDGVYLTCCKFFNSRQIELMSFFQNYDADEGMYIPGGKKNMFCMWDEAVGYIPIDEVTHWMPLPDYPNE